MKAYLMYKNSDFDIKKKLPWNAQDLIQDLELNTMFNSMACGDEFLLDVVKRAVLCSLNDKDTILYRQNILKDCIKNPSVIRDIYDISVKAIDNEQKNYFGFYMHYPSAILHRSIVVLDMFFKLLKEIKNICDTNKYNFKSEGFTTFFKMIDDNLDDEYLKCVQEHLNYLKFNNGTLISAELGKGNKGINYTLRKSKENKSNWLKRIFTKKPPAFTMYIAERDQSGYDALNELKDRGLNYSADSLGQSTDHILNFFKMLRVESAFYVGCLNLYNQISKINEPVTFPEIFEMNERKHSFKGLYDICLALNIKKQVVGNDLDADNKDLAIITGANQGGKSTFLRSIGLSQLMMQCGMFVPAEYFRANICSKIFTHYRREEDSAMNSGKLDEELKRMSDIIDNMPPNSTILFNESFAATNEREGSEIAKQITSALIEKNIKVFFVTHQFEFPNYFYNKRMDNVIFLRAERQNNGGRTFKITEGKPLQTSFGQDLYKKVFKINN